MKFLVMPLHAAHGRALSFVAGIYRGESLIATTLPVSDRNRAALAANALIRATEPATVPKSTINTYVPWSQNRSPLGPKS